MSVTIAAADVVVRTKGGEQVLQDVLDDINGARGAEGAGQSLGRKVFGGVIAAWGAIGGVQAVTGWFAGAVQGAGDLNETMSASQVIFGDQAGAMLAWSQNAATSFGMSQQAALESTLTFGDMFLQLGATGDEAAGTSQQLVQMAADLGSFRNVDPTIVLESISAAMRGEYDSLQALIPNINAARVEQEALAMTGKTSASELTALERANAAVNIVMTDGARAAGDFARTSDGAANSQRILAAQLEDQQAAVGQALLPAWVGFLGFMRDSVIPMFTDVATWVQENTGVLAALAAGVGAAAIVYGVLTPAMAIYRAYTVAAAATTGGLTVAQWALNAAMTANPIGIIIVAVGALVAGIVWLATQTTFFQDAWQWMVDAVGVAWQWLLDNVITPVGDAIGAALGWIDTNVLQPLVAAFDAAVAGVQGAIGWLTDTVDMAVLGWQIIFAWVDTNILQPLTTAFWVVFGIIAGIVTWLVDTVVKPAFDRFGAAVTWVHDNVIAPVFAAIGAVFQWLDTNVVQPVVNAITLSIQGWGMIFDWLYNNAVKPAIDGVGAAVQWVKSSVIDPVVAGVQNGIRAWGMIFDWLYRNAVQPAVQGVGSALQWVKNSVIDPVVNGISSTITNVGNTVQSVFGGIAGFMRDAFTNAGNVIRGPINGIIGLVNRAIRGLNGLSVTIPDWVPEVGGQTWGISLPTIPMLARGTNRAPDAFIAGEAGPELITGARGATVVPYSQTRDRMSAAASSPGTVIHIDKVVLDATNVRELNDLVELFEALPQVARAGRGTTWR